MRTTVSLDDDFVAKAKSYTGVQEIATLLRMGLTALVQREAARRLAVAAENDEVLQFIAIYSLSGTGIGYVDAHLLVAAKVTGDTLI